MRHIYPYTAFINERNDIENSIYVAELAQRFVDGLINRMSTIFNDYIRNAATVSSDIRDNNYNYVSVINFFRRGIGLSDIQIEVKLQPHNEPNVGAYFNADKKEIIVYSSKVCSAISKFKNAALKALYGTNTYDIQFNVDDASKALQDIKDCDYTKFIFFLEHEIVHYLDTKDSSKFGEITRKQIMNYQMDKQRTNITRHLAKVRHGINRTQKWDEDPSDKEMNKLIQNLHYNDYVESEEFSKYKDKLYYNSNHEYNAYYTAFASQIIKKVKAGMSLSDDFGNFIKETDADKIMRLEKMNPKVKRQMLKRLYDLYSRLKNAEIEK